MRNGTFDRFLLLAVLASLLVAAGCGPKVTRTANVADGDYYTAEEFENLSKEQRDRYCADLDDELARLDGDSQRSEREVSDLGNELSGLQGEIRNLQGRYDAAQAEVDGVQEEIDYFEGLPRTHVVTEGEFLQKISEYERIYADPAKWTRIYRANKEMLEGNPNLIYPGWELTIPRNWPRQWTVKQDEYLSRIASYWEVYGDGTEWTRIYEANRNQISDPDMIWPDWELSIPRN